MQGRIYNSNTKGECVVADKWFKSAGCMLHIVCAIYNVIYNGEDTSQTSRVFPLCLINGLKSALYVYCILYICNVQGDVQKREIQARPG